VSSVLMVTITVRTNKRKIKAKINPVLLHKLKLMMLNT